MQTLQQLTPDQRDNLLRILAGSDAAKLVLAQHRADNREQRRKILASIEPSIAQAAKELAPRVKTVLKLQAEADDLKARLMTVTAELNPLAYSVSHQSQTIDAMRDCFESELAALADPRINHVLVYVGNCSDAVQANTKFHMVTKRDGWLGQSHRVEQSNITELTAFIKKLDAIRDMLLDLQINDYDPESLPGVLSAAMDEAQKLARESGSQYQPKRPELSDF